MSEMSPETENPLAEAVLAFLRRSASDLAGMETFEDFMRLTEERRR